MIPHRPKPNHQLSLLGEGEWLSEYDIGLPFRTAAPEKVSGTAHFDPKASAPGSWQRIGGASPPRGRSSQPPRPRVMHEVLLARAAVKRSQRRPWAKY